MSVRPESDLYDFPFMDFRGLCLLGGRFLSECEKWADTFSLLIEEDGTSSPFE
jgi:hypothetical protein